MIEFSDSIAFMLRPVLEAYITSTTAPPPPWASTRASACEICEREWIPLTYHHLIPRSTHAKVLKRGWHEEWELNKVAWLCRACHSFVHSIESNEELARAWYSVESLRAREDVQKWAAWVGRIRWKAR
jgi:5-methylcytosine-specific restriction endonuclease McrA